MKKRIYKYIFFLVLGVMLLASCSDGIEGELKELCKKQDVYSVTCVISDKVSQSAHVYKFEDGRVWLSANMFDWTDCYMLNRMTGYNVRTINHYNYLYIYFYDNTAHTEP